MAIILLVAINGGLPMCMGMYCNMVRTYAAISSKIWSFGAVEVPVASLLTMVYKPQRESFLGAALHASSTLL